MLCSWVAAGVGKGAAVVDASAVIDDSGSGCVVCASTAGGVGSAAAGLGGAAAGAGLLRAALGANFLPVVFSTQISAFWTDHHMRHGVLLMKELVKAAGAGLAGRPGALSLPAAGGCVEPPSADISVRRLYGEKVVEYWRHRDKFWWTGHSR